ncbi:MAG: surface lipoprotein assembly modifier [Gammaproteobacteria bacterium]|nr:surface lipoprotein assembly modifier [Gammaproteobacteria bacterium]
MLERQLRALLLMAFIFPLNSLAAEAFDLPFLQNLFKTYQRQQAYDYASQYLSQMEGDPYFDYLYGVSAIDTGHASQGVFALERVLFAFPEDHVTRLELARGYFILEEYARARQEFEIVLKISPPKGVQDTAQLFIDKIRLQEARYKTTSSGYVELAMGSDSNVNSGVDQNELTIITTLTPDSLGQDDTFANLSAAWQMTQPVAPGWLVNGAITGSLRKNSELSQFDNITATLQAGITRLDRDSRYKAEVISQQYNLDGNSYRKLNGLNLGWHYAITQKSNLTTSIQYAALDYPDLPVKNSNLTALGLSYSHTFASALSPTLFAGINLGTESAKENLTDALSITERDISGLRAGIMLSLNDKTALQLSTAMQTSEYADRHPLNLSAIREDDHVSADLNLLWLFKRDWRLDAKASYSDNQSNVEIFRYNRTQFSLNLNYAF